MKRRGSSPGGASSSAHRALNVLNEEAENNPQFQATQLWNRITRKFCKDVPRKRHRKNIRFYDDTFTGKEAIDFLLGVLPSLLDGNRDVTRAKCILLAEKFFENDIIRHFRGDHLIGFKDSAELYELSPAGLEIGKSARPFRRASSFNERKPKQTWPQNLNVTRKIEPLPSIVIPTSPPKLSASRRLSMSHGNLTALHDSHESSRLHNSSLKISTDLSFITEKIVSPSAVESQPMPSPSAVRIPPVVRTEVDLFQLWKFSLLDQLAKILDLSDVSTVLNEQFDGADVKWNAECIGSRGIVKARSENGEFPTILMKMMRYVARYPFDQSRELAKVSYRGMEVDTFSNICGELSKYGQLLPNPVAIGLLQMVSIFSERSKSRQELEESEGNFSDIRRSCENIPTYQTEFAKSQPHRASVSALSLRNEQCNTPLSRFRNSAAVRSLQPTGPPVASLFGKQRSLTDSGLNMSPFMGLPGLIQSPELLQQIDQLTRESGSASGDAGFSYQQPETAPPRSPYKPPSISQSALVSGIHKDDLDDLITAMSLILLTLPTALRRRLHFVIRFMQRVSSNNCLRLNDFKENRYVVLERLAPSVIQPSHSPEVPPAKAVQLVTFLMDHESRVFAVPERLLKAVADLAKPSAESNATPNRSTLSSAPAVSPDRQYCTVVDKNEYNSQDYVKTSIRELLTQICKDQTLTEEKRKRCLRNFQQTYPEIYKERFPPSNSPPAERRTPLPRFLNKLRNMKLKN
ncbi:hypothetical protein QR680_003129 [Steinernema hermaphroditum]|uniref:DEP domain-containing protein n=1 Tax=Steinernema hermaphroditum TaxID=289476 RepID=A0AA39H6E7_9BILA|nr:hypothetical protein QR680_003129 [Steinernema hermaphroditum]